MIFKTAFWGGERFSTTLEVTKSFPQQPCCDNSAARAEHEWNAREDLVTLTANETFFFFFLLNHKHCLWFWFAFIFPFSITFVSGFALLMALFLDLFPLFFLSLCLGVKEGNLSIYLSIHLPWWCEQTPHRWRVHPLATCTEWIRSSLAALCLSCTPPSRSPCPSAAPGPLQGKVGESDRGQKVERDNEAPKTKTKSIE